MSFGNNEYKSWKCLNYFYTDIITKEICWWQRRGKYLITCEHGQVVSI